MTNAHTLALEEVHIEDSTGYGLLGLNVLGDSVVLNSTFRCNNNINNTDECHFQRWNKLSRERKEISDIGGNALFVHSNSSHGANLRITDSQFSQGRNGHNYFNLGGGGLGICLHAYCSSAHNVSVTIFNCTFDSNAAHLGANVFIDITSLKICHTCSYAVHISNSTFSNGDASVGGGGLYFKYSVNLKTCRNSWFASVVPHLYKVLPTPFGYNWSIVIDVQIHFSHFLNNSGGGEGGGIFTWFSTD